MSGRRKVNEQFVNQRNDPPSSHPTDNVPEVTTEAGSLEMISVSENLDRYIEEILGSLLHNDDVQDLTLSAITDENILDFSERSGEQKATFSALPSEDQSEGRVGGLSYKICCQICFLSVQQPSRATNDLVIPGHSKYYAFTFLDQI